MKTLASIGIALCSLGVSAAVYYTITDENKRLVDRINLSNKYHGARNVVEHKVKTIKTYFKDLILSY